MKQFVLSFLLFLALSNFVNADTITWIGESCPPPQTVLNNWNCPENWSTGNVPDNTADVIIPSGSYVYSLLGIDVNSLVLESGATIFSTSVISVQDTATIEAGAEIIGNFAFQYGTFDNYGTVRVTVQDPFFPAMGNFGLDFEAVFNNYGTVIAGSNLAGGNDVVIRGDAVFNNQPSGVFNLLEDVDVFMVDNTGNDLQNFNNYGTILKNGGISSTWSGRLNDFGEIEVWALNTLTLNNPTLVDSNLIVETDGSLNFNSVTLDGTMTGQIEGEVNLLGSIIVPNTGILNFSSTGNINWTGGTLDGGGTLINQGEFVLKGSTKTILGNTTFSNQGTMITQESGSLAINDGGLLQNETGGVFDIQNGQLFTGDALFRNFGLVKKTTDPGNSSMLVPFENDNGTIQVETGTLGFNDPDHVFTNGAYNVFPGATLNWGVTASSVRVLGTLLGVIDGTMNWSNQLEVDTTVDFNFSGTGDFNWQSGTLRGGGILNNNSQMQINTASNKLIDENTTFNNFGTVEMQAGTLSLTNGEFINQIPGTLDHQAGLITGNSTLTNFGTLAKTVGASNSSITSPVLNDSGTFQIDAGFLQLNNLDNIFTNGSYNVSDGATFDWGVASRAVEVSGDLTGTVNGEMNWNNRLLVPTIASFDFNGSGNFNWKAGDLEGGGVLSQKGTMRIAESGAVNIIDGTTLSNEGDLFIEKNISISEGTIQNTALGSLTIDNATNMSQGGSGSNRFINNEGYLLKTGVGLYSLSAEVNNSGIMEIAEGTLFFSGTLPFNNLTTGIVKGVGTLQLPANNNYTNLGTFAPGASPGSLTVIGNYITSPTSLLDLELDGPSQGADYDVLNVVGTASLEGNVQVTLGYEPQINDEFIVLTTTSTINTCNLPSQLSTNYNGSDYVVLIDCVDNNKLVLTVSEVLNVDSAEHIAKSIQFYPNPSIDYIAINNRSNDILDWIEIIDLNGRTVISVAGTGDQQQRINTSVLSPGMYMVRIYGGFGSIVKRMIKR